METENSKVGMVKFYKAKYVWKHGFPFAIVTSQQTEENRFGAEVFLMMQQSPSREFTLVEAHISSGPSITSLHDAGIADVQEFMAESALAWLKNDLESKHVDAGMNGGVVENGVECELESRDWKRGLVHLRLDGLSEKVIMQIRRNTESKELSAYLNGVVKLRPNIVKCYPMPEVKEARC